MAGKKKQIVIPQTNTNEFAEMSKNVQICNDGKFHYSLDECRFKYKTSRKNSDSSV